MSSKIITIVYNTTFYVYKFRINLIQDLKDQGFRIIVVSPEDEYVETLKNLGIEHHKIDMSQYGMNPLKEIGSTWEIYQVFKRYRPVCSLHYTIKPNIFGGIAAAMAKVPVINNIAGAGRAFSDQKSLFAYFISCLFRIGLRRSKKVFFQNYDDMKLFVSQGVVRQEVAERIPGSGVDLERYHLSVPDMTDGTFRFLFIGRLLKEKGIEEYLAAAQSVLTVSMRRVCIEIVGELDNAGACISQDSLSAYLQDPRYVYHGAVSPDQMPAIIGRAHCVVLPSYYREGIPRSLLEAAAMAKPIITTDNVGCREVVDEGVNGYKVPVRDTAALQEAMERMLLLSQEELRAMGQAGRKKVEREFDERFVLEAYRRAVAKITLKI